MHGHLVHRLHPLRGYHIKREKQHKTFKGVAQKGQCSIGWFHGFKLHLVINDKGEILDFILTPGNVDDREPLKNMENALMLDFISYEHVGTIRRESEARKFVRNNFNMNLQFGWATAFYQNKVDILQDIPSSARFHVDNYSLSLLGKKAVKNMLNTISEEYIHVGDEIFAIEYIIELQKYRYYVFINSTTKKVLTEGYIFAFEFPMTHIEYIDGR